MADAVLEGRMSTTAHADSKGTAAPPNPYKYGERAILGNEVVPGLTLVIGHLPPGCTYKALKTFAIQADTDPVWAVVFGSGRSLTGAWIQDSPRYH